MALIGVDNFLWRVSSVRSCWFRGPMGSGKTLVAVACSMEMVRRKMARGVVSNIPHSLPMHPWRELHEDGENLGVREGVILFDEPWQQLDARTSMQNPREYGGFSRKLGVTYMLPSVHIIDKRLTGVQCERVFRHKIPLIHYVLRLFTFLPFIGGWAKEWLLPLMDELWWYRWQFVEGDVAIDQGYFLLTSPSSYFPMYDTKYIPLDDAGISSLWHWTIAKLGTVEDDDGQWWTVEAQPETGSSGSGFGGVDISEVRKISSRLSRVGSAD